MEVLVVQPGESHDCELPMPTNEDSKELSDKDSVEHTERLALEAPDCTPPEVVTVPNPPPLSHTLPKYLHRPLGNTKGTTL